MSGCARALRFVLAFVFGFLFVLLSVPSFAAGALTSFITHPLTAPREMTLTLRPGPDAADGGAPTFGFVLSEPADYVLSPDPLVRPYGSPTITDKFSAPGPTVLLRLDEPVEITVVNNLPDATAVRVLGLELGIDGDDVRSTPVIAPGESFTLRFTPRRAGTFVYQADLRDDGPQRSNLYGTLLVKDPIDPAFKTAGLPVQK